MKHTASFIISAAFLIFSLSCGGGGGSSKGGYTEPNPPSPDTSAPYIASSSAKSDKMISVIFSEMVTKESTEKTSSYTIQGGKTTPKVTAAVLSGDNKTVTLTLDSSMESGTSYTLAAASISDTVGNILISGSSRFTGRGPVNAVLSGLPSSITNSRSASVSVSGTDITGYQYSLNGGTWSGEQKISSAISLSNLQDGNVTIEVVGKDSLGNWQPYSSPTSYSWTIDTQPPVCILTDTPPSVTNLDSASISVKGPQVTSYRYKIGNDRWSDPIDSTEQIILADLDDGTVTLSVIGMDAAGNWQNESSPTVSTWRINTSMPAVTLSGIPSYITSDTRVSAVAGGVDVVAYKFRIDGGSWSDEFPVGESNPITLTNLYEGSHSIEALGKNDAGTWQSADSPSRYSWTIDRTPPVIRFSSTPDPESSDRKPTFSVIGDSDLASFRYKLDGGEWSGIESALSPLSVDVDEGTHTIRIIGIDYAGNEQSAVSAASYSWKSDFTAPTAHLSSLPQSVTNMTGASITVSGTGVRQYKYALDGGEWSSPSGTGDPISLNSLSEAVHTVKVIGCDTAGNWQDISSASVYSWTVDITPPSAGATNLPANLTGSNTADITVTGEGIVSYLYSIDGGNWIEKSADLRITLSSLSEGVHTLAIRGKDEAGNVQTDSFTYRWNVDLSAPTAVLDGTPSVKNNLTSLSVSVGGTDVAAYRYSFDGSSYSSEKTAASPIEISSIDAGHHDIAVIGRDAQGNWQSTDSPTRFAWQSDFTAPSAVLSPLPDPVTNVTSYEITVAGDDLATFRYTLDGVSSGVLDQGSPITLRNIREGGHTLSVSGTDSFGNTQSTPTSYTWSVDTTAPTAPSMREAAAESESENIIFNFTAPSGVDKADVQISTDAAFATVLYQSGAFSAAEGASSFTYTASEANGNTYYARVRVGDSAGNWSSYGTKSGRVTLVGGVSGEIRNNSGQVLSGAAVRLYTALNTPVTTASAGADGKFRMSGVPAGINDYYAVVEMSGYTNAMKANIAVHTGAVSDNGIITLVSNSALPGTVTGKIVNANDGTRISGATVAILNFRGTVVDTQQTTNGVFTTVSLAPGTYSAKITKSNFFDMRVDNLVVNGNADIGNQALCELITGNHVRVVLIWGAQPRDLDLHVVGPSDIPVSQDGDPANRFHVYWTQKSFDASVGKYSGENGFTSYTSSLVQDSTGGYGVEAINSWNLMAKGVYTFTVHNYSKANWYLSSPVLRIYDNQGLVQEVPIPSGAGTQWYWKAFQINIQGDSRDQRSIRIENKFGTLNYSSKASMDWQLESGGVTAYLLSVAKGEHPALIAMLLIVMILFTALYFWNRRKSGTDDSSPM